MDNVPGSMTITDRSGQVVVLDHEKANILVRQGSMHKLDQALIWYKDEE